MGFAGPMHGKGHAWDQHEEALGASVSADGSSAWHQMKQRSTWPQRSRAGAQFSSAMDAGWQQQ